MSRNKNGLALIKLGGSVITFKNKPLAANYRAINGLCRTLAEIKSIPIIIVHGGGSFGHYWSVKFDMHTRPDTYHPNGVAVVHESMIALNQIVVRSMLKKKINPYSFTPWSITMGARKPIRQKINELQDMANSALFPITFGDIVHTGAGKYSILSGDALVSILAKVLRPSKVVFATNVDGIYRALEGGELVKEIRQRDYGEFGSFRSERFECSKTVGPDVTGGMQRKIGEAFKITAAGMDVLIVNGLKPERIAAAVTGASNFVGTVIKAHRRN